ncbi:hypothetical protein Poli38472_009845 [Pythium oligandrum]|uniref:CAMK/CAMK1 protein kinase n=1 Tax=Pythium oligandrum TaxID=41045 RepID=A0A8K1CHR9_PYTOL|nr:hypothetical protein Poli38472_009845 [Pythium oligandrum]|eukprot:TMW62352.1 hypothetical protein Poli38472_009845 [Pythium oligandrum]
MEDAMDFEDAAKKSWQSFSTMKRFVSEAHRLENATWRLWYMQKLHRQRTTPCETSSSVSANDDTVATVLVMCVYCDIHTASLSCHGCCHDAYCVSCFKLIHKKGHLATHTAVKIKTLPPREIERLAVAQEATSEEYHSPSHDHEGSVTRSSSASSSLVGDTSAHGHNSPQESPSRDGMRKPKIKSWEVQMDMLLQRLMVNSIHHEEDISVHNIDGRESLGTDEGLLSFASESAPDIEAAVLPHQVTEAVAASEESAASSDDQPLFVGITPAKSEDSADAVAQESVRRARVPSSPLISAISAAASPAMSPALAPLQSPSIAPLQPAGTDLNEMSSSLFALPNLTRTKSRKKNSVCANCSGNHITIDCPLLESYLPSTSMQGPGNVDTMLRKCFTTIHNDNLSNSTHAFLGDEISVRGGGNFSKGQFASSSAVRPLGGGDQDASTWTSFGMNSIAEDQTADVHDTLPVLAAFTAANDNPHRWDSTSWMMSSLATDLPHDVFETLRKAEKSCSSPSGSSHSDEIGPSLSGWVHLKEPGTKWRKRYVSLFRNTVWEYLDDRETSRPIGYANLAEGSIHAHQTTTLEFTVRYYRHSSPDSARSDCWIQFESDEEAERWRNDLHRATKLQIEDLFELQPDSHSPTEGYELGKGRFSSVRRACRKRVRIDSNSPRHDCALKIIDKNIFWDLVAHETEREDTVIREILTQTVLTVRAGTSYCPVIRLLSLFETRNHLVLELELMREGDLHEEIVSKSAVDENHAPYLVASLVRAIDYCLRNGIAHRDVKLSNLALDHSLCSKGQRYSVIKIADFGMAAFIECDGRLRGRCGTPGFVAPEILTAGKGESYPAGVDMFSVGVVTYTMLCGYEPFFGVNDEELIQMNKSVEFEFEEPEWSSISDEAKDLICCMMEKDTSKRISASEALRHPFLEEASTALEGIDEVEIPGCPLRLL